eukprot:126664_1
MYHLTLMLIVTITNYHSTNASGEDPRAAVAAEIVKNLQNLIMNDDDAQSIVDTLSTDDAQWQTEIQNKLNVIKESTEFLEQRERARKNEKTEDKLTDTVVEGIEAVSSIGNGVVSLIAGYDIGTTFDPDANPEKKKQYKIMKKFKAWGTTIKGMGQLAKVLTHRDKGGHYFHCLQKLNKFCKFIPVAGTVIEVSMDIGMALFAPESETKQMERRLGKQLDAGFDSLRIATKEVGEKINDKLEGMQTHLMSYMNGINRDIKDHVTFEIDRAVAEITIHQTKIVYSKFVYFLHLLDDDIDAVCTLFTVAQQNRRNMTVSLWNSQKQMITEYRTHWRDYNGLLPLMCTLLNHLEVEYTKYDHAAQNQNIASLYAEMIESVYYATLKMETFAIYLRLYSVTLMYQTNP